MGWGGRDDGGGGGGGGGGCGGGGACPLVAVNLVIDVICDLLLV